MKNTLFILAFCCNLFSVSAQKVTVDIDMQELGGGFNSGYTVFVPHATVKTVEKK